MKKFLTVAITGLMFSSTAMVASAHHNTDHTQNYHGLCTAYFSGSENGQEKKQENGMAFMVFRETIGDYNGDDTEDNQDVMDFCTDMTGGFGNPGQGGGSGDGDNGNNNPPGRG